MSVREVSTDDIRQGPGPGPRRLTSIGYFGFVLIGWNSVLFPSLIRSVEHDFQRTDATFALLYFLSALIYATGTLSGGFLTERLGRKIVLPPAAIALGLGIVGEGLAPTWVILLVATVPVGWGAGAIDGGTNGLFLDLYRDARGGALNLLHVFFSVGAFVAPFVVGLLLSHGVAWRSVLIGTGVFALPLAITLLRTAMPSGKHHGRPEPAALVHDDTGDENQADAGTSLVPFAGLAVSIGFYVAAEVGVSSWVVRFLANAPISTATAVLSIFWGGLTAGRLLSSRFADRFEYFAFTLGCIVLSAVALVGALTVPWLPMVAILFGVTGLFSGPIFPMIIALGGNIYPHRLAALSGGLTTSAVAGGLIYPPSIGLLASTIGIRGGLFGAALLGIPQAVGIIVARHTSRAALSGERLPGT